jgi:hypothetical protein
MQVCKEIRLLQSHHLEARLRLSKSGEMDIGCLSIHLLLSSALSPVNNNMKVCRINWNSLPGGINRWVPPFQITNLGLGCIENDGV